MTAVTTTEYGEPVRTQSTAKTVLGTGIGNALEWFDWGVYAIFAPFFATQFFPAEDPLAAILATYLVFAVGFVARPLGGLLFGWLGDRKGRRFAMAVAVAGAAAGTTVIGISPTYDDVGVLAAVILVAARLVQGLAHGGELPSAQTYIAEFAPKRRRGLWSSLIYVSGTLGNVIGLLIGAVLSGVLVKSDMAAWGWRVPFLVGGALGLYALFMRSKLHETEQFQEDVLDAPDAVTPRIWAEIKAHRRQALQVVGTTVGLTVAFYTWSIAMSAYAISALQIDASHALWASVVANLVFIVALPIWGSLSDRVGRKPVLGVGVVGLAVLSLPMSAIVRDSAIQLGIAMTVMLVFMAAPAAIVPAVYSELFPTHIRTIGVGVPYSISVAVFGGTAPYLQQWMSSAWGPISFMVYLVGLLVVSGLVVWGLPETRGLDLHESAADSPL